MLKSNQWKYFRSSQPELYWKMNVLEILESSLKSTCLGDFSKPLFMGDM